MVTFNYLMAQALLILNAKLKRENTAKRVGGLFRDLLNFIQNAILGIILKGELTNATAIKAVVNPSKGDTYRAIDTSHYWCYDGSKWNDIGIIIPSDTVTASQLSQSVTSETNTAPSNKAVRVELNNKANQKTVVGYNKFIKGYINKETGAIVSNNEYLYILVNSEDFTSIIVSISNYTGGSYPAVIACYGEYNRYLGSLLNGNDLINDIEDQEFVFKEGTRKVGISVSKDTILNFNFRELNLLNLDSNKVRTGYEKKNGYINKDTGVISVGSPSIDYYWYITIPISENVKSFSYTLKKWEGGSSVSLIACYGENGVYLGSMLNGTTSTLADIENREFLIIENTKTIILTSKDSALMDCSLLNNNMLENYQRNIMGISDNINREFIDQFNLTSDAIGTVGYKGLGMIKDSGIIQRNFAISKEPNIASVSLSFYPIYSAIMANMQIARIAFGNTLVNYYFHFQKGDMTYIDMYFCTQTEIIKIGSLGTTYIIQPGDYITIDRRGLFFKVYINKVLRSSAMATRGFIEPMGGGFCFRDAINNYFAKDISIKKDCPKYMHISVDDTSGVLKDLNENANSYTSIFDNPILAFYKQLHDSYGMVISLYCFFEHNGFKLSDMTTKYKDELSLNSYWLKWGFHAENQNSNYNNLDAMVLVDEYTKTYNCIANFAGYNSIDNMPRFHLFAAKKEALQILRDTCGLKGCLTADDNRENNSGLTEVEREVVTSCDDYYDYLNKLYYCQTEYRMDNDTATSIVPKLQNLYNSTTNRDIYIMFFHEGKSSSQSGKEMLEACVKWAKNKNIGFDFPQNNIFY